MMRKLSLLIFSLVSTAAYASLDSAFTGKVVSIANDNEEVLVRLADGNKTETFKICSEDDERMKSLREAFTRGEVVKASFNGPFDRCLSRIEIHKDVQPAKAEPPAKKEKAITKADGPRKPSSIN